MKIEFTVCANWGRNEVEFLEKHGIIVSEGFSSFYLRGNDILLNLLKDKFHKVKDFEIFESFAVYDINDFSFQKKYSVLLPGNTFPEINIPKMDIFNFRKTFFGGKCSNCFLGLQNNQTKNIEFSIEPKMKKNQIGFHYLDLWFTDFENYNLYFEKFGLGFLNVAIGPEKRRSENLVQLDIPFAMSKLKFVNSKFGMILKSCDLCKQTIHQNAILDYFPDFEVEVPTFHVIKTIEYFGYYHYMICSTEFLDFLLSKNLIKDKLISTIPIKSF